MAIKKRKTWRIINKVPADLRDELPDVDEIVENFTELCAPMETTLYVMVDARTNARYCECHLRASAIIDLGTIDGPLDPEEQPEYRANREVVEDAVAYERMIDDAKERRTFSNIVAEFTVEWGEAQPLKIIGGQHRFNAIKEALLEEVNEFHGLKIFFGLTMEQRADVQLISNTNIAVSTDLFDRMQETQAGPELRNWCQGCGLLEKGRDFADKRKSGNPLTVRAVRTFIMSYLKGRLVKAVDFDKTNTTPVIATTGVIDPDWEDVRNNHPDLWEDAQLKKAGQEFAALIAAQRAAHQGKGASKDFEQKAMNFAVISAWAFVAGMLHDNATRLRRLFDLRTTKGKDPLNAAALAKGRHKSDAHNYRGLGYRTDAKERGRFVELFHYHAEKGEGITKASIEVAIKRYHAKQAQLDAKEAEEKDSHG